MGIAIPYTSKLNIRSVGENSHAASSVGVSVIRVKYHNDYHEVYSAVWVEQHVYVYDGLVPRHGCWTWIVYLAQAMVLQ